MISMNPRQLAELHADQTSDGRREEAEARRTQGEDGCKTGTKSNRRGERGESQ